MPYKSEAQRSKFHALEKEGKISKETVREFDEASKDKSLPDRVKKRVSGKKTRKPGYPHIARRRG